MPNVILEQFSKLWCYVKERNEKIDGVWDFTNGVKSKGEDVLTHADITPLLPHPTYIMPQSSLSSTRSSSDIEVGSTIDIPLASTFIQNDAGNATASSLRKNGTQISNLYNYTDTGVFITTIPKNYQSIISYDQGSIKNNSLGVPDPIGRISAGTINSNILSYRGYYYIPYGATATNPTNSTEARDLPQGRLSNSGNTFILNSGTTFVKQVIVVTPGNNLQSVVDLDASSQDITLQYVLVSSNFTVNDASGTPVSGYKLYIRTQGTAYLINHRHQITIS